MDDCRGGSAPVPSSKFAKGKIYLLPNLKDPSQFQEENKNHPGWRWSQYTWERGKSHLLEAVTQEVPCPDHRASVVFLPDEATTIYTKPEDPTAYGYSGQEHSECIRYREYPWPICL